MTNGWFNLKVAFEIGVAKPLIVNTLMNYIVVYVFALTGDLFTSIPAAVVHTFQLQSCFLFSSTIFQHANTFHRDKYQTITFKTLQP